jgi:hypothetical protein
VAEANDAPELRPCATLAVGVTGHRDIGVTGATADSISPAFDRIFRSLAGAFETAAAANTSFFSGATPKMRVVCMAADGADLLGAVAAQKCGAEVAVILPFPADEYRKDFGPAAVELFDRISTAAVTRFVLPGSREEDARAYERANQVILANIDILIAAWDGKRASGRAGTGDVVPDALSRSIPTIVIDPKAPDQPSIIIPRPASVLGEALVKQTGWQTLNEDLLPLVAEQIAPPAGETKRRGLIDFYAETPRSAIWRIEYPSLLALFGATRTHGATSPAADPQPVPNLDSLGRMTGRIDQFAAYYGQLFRSSAVSRFLLIVIVAVLSGLIGLLFPGLFGVSLVLQLAVNILVLLDSTIGGRRRWQERWLDYRLLAERLRSLRFLHRLGLGPDIGAGAFPPQRSSWTDWYARRTARALDAPAGMVSAPELSSLAKQLVGQEIHEQVTYHRGAVRQLGTLERRLAFAASLALYTTILVGGALGVAAYFLGGLEAVWWKPAANVLLAALPAAMTAFNGIRADSDLVRLVERSAMTASSLARIGRTVSQLPLTYDGLAAAAARVATIMANERSEWRFVLESRRTRSKRRKAMRRHWRSRFRLMREPNQPAQRR